MMSLVAAAAAVGVKEQEHQAEHYYKGYDPVKDDEETDDEAIELGNVTKAIFKNRCLFSIGGSGEMMSPISAVAASVKEEEHQVEHYYKGYDPVKDEETDDEATELVNATKASYNVKEEEVDVKVKVDDCSNITDDEIEYHSMRRRTSSRLAKVNTVRIASQSVMISKQRNKGIQINHNGTKKYIYICSHDGCNSHAKVGGVCIKHGAQIKRCSHNNCTKQAQIGGVCVRHGAKIRRPKICSYDGCINRSKESGVCIRHGAKLEHYTCNYNGCNNWAVRGGVCKRHGCANKRSRSSSSAIHMGIILLMLIVLCCLMPVYAFSPTYERRMNNGCSVELMLLSATSDLQNEESASLDSITTSTKPQRRIRYSGRYPRNFQDRYKEQSGDEETINKVLAKGMTPAGTHVPIMVKECLHYMGLDEKQSDEIKKGQPTLVVDCTLGYGGHSSYILRHLLKSSTTDATRLIAFDQDSVEIKKTEERLRQTVLNQTSIEDDHNNIFTAVNQNFETLGTYLSSTNQMGTVTSLLADLGLSSMQIDDNDRGFTYKRSGPLDMRMNPEDDTKETAYDLLKRLRVRKLKSILKENSDEEFAAEIAYGLIGRDNKIPETTVELADRVREIVQPLIIKQNNWNSQKELGKNQMNKMKNQLDSTVARVMQAIRIEVNGEFEVLDKLLEDIPNVLSPGGQAVFLTFHSGEDRRVKKAFKSGFKSGVYSAWSRDVVRPSKEERRNNPRSSCCKLRWAIRSEENI